MKGRHLERCMKIQRKKELSCLSIFEEKSKCIIEENGFSRDGICQDIKSEYTNAQPLMMAEKEISDAIEKCRESCEFSDDILNNPVVYEHPENSINIAVDDVIVKKQEENREGERKAERGKRKYVHNTILYVTRESNFLICY